ncbi:unnamed protein product [Rotaria sordida]|uniref:Secreted protein n=1 Tax=Rotaria sordida TaxID=392033 RepID=A0A814MDM6_9BILA|nr:unnamed protein product [Rotaria sordida]CAF0955286.1 unnamed protein product [Rotaria sordida]CAF0986429.1 unnamed protein product [Rotaria sordida]CAF1069270.1 unnamed protein product [Rotaria sordida]CAF1076929.1 unnamed protein product [Rotaria sordida]
MFLLILVLLISIPLVSPSYHIPKLGRYHTFLRIGKRYFTEPCINTYLCTSNQQRIPTKCFVFFNRHLCWPQINEEKTMKEQDSRQNHLNNRFIQDNT